MNDDLESVIRARDHLAGMYEDSEKRLTAALEANECLLIGIQACAVPHEGERQVLQEAVEMARACVQTGQASTENGQG